MFSDEFKKLKDMSEQELYEEFQTYTTPVIRRVMYFAQRLIIACERLIETKKKQAGYTGDND